MIMDEYDQRARVVAITMEWERTPYIHQGRIKGVAADCTFFYKVFEESGLIPTIDIPFYSHQAHLNRQSSAYLPMVQKYAKREVQQDEAQAGDVVMYHIARSWSHGAVIINPGWPHILHADMGARFVIRALGDQGHFLNAPRRFFSFW